MFENGILHVVPDPGGYRLSFEMHTTTEALGLGGPRVEIDVQPYSVLLNRRPDGTWAIEGAGAFEAAYTIKGGPQAGSVSYAVNDVHYDGIYSPQVGAFLSFDGRTDGTTMRQTTPRATVVATMGPQSLSMKGKARNDRSVDFTYSQTGQSLEEVLSVIDPADPSRRMPVDVTAKGMTMTTTGSGLKSRSLLDLYAFALGHASRQAMIAGQDELKERLRRLLPVFDGLEANNSFEDVSIHGPFGDIGAKTAGLEVSLDGVESDGDYRYAFSLDGLSINVPTLPS